MNAKGIELLRNPHPCGHIVYPYTDSTHIVDAVGLFASAGIENDEAVVIIATDPHCKLIQERLERDGFDLNRLRRTHQLIFRQAEDVLATFMARGMPDEELFKKNVAEILRQARTGSSDGQPRKVRLFGEMVSLLWRVDPAAAVRLEELWNEVIDYHVVSVLCTYTLDGDAYAQLPDSLITPHKHLLAS